jgi:cellulose synthase/poly-beta-1,6-N-acetylglucosamine synthase-like glycosyltransferase
MARVQTALEIVQWTALALIVWTQVGYALVLATLARLLTPTPTTADAAIAAERSGAHPNSSPDDHGPAGPAGGLPRVALIVAAHDEQAVIAAKVANALALDYPRELLEVLVACDGCTDATAERARAAGADVVLELPRGGKIRAQDAAVARARAGSEVVAFSDANSTWEPDALRELVGAFADRRVGYACGQVRFFLDRHPADGHARAQGARATNQEGVYWRYEMAQRGWESRLGSITAGNGAIYATRRESYLVVDPIMGHDLSFPFNLVKRGWRAVYVPGARASEKMVPSIEGELRRKRRMMSHTWPIVLRGGMLDPRGYPPGYALAILSHRLLRYATPFLHALAFAANFALVLAYPPGTAGGVSGIYTVTLTLQVLLGACAGLGGLIRVRPLLIARYYFLTTAALALGLWDWLRHGTSAAWEAAEGTR